RATTTRMIIIIRAAVYASDEVLIEAWAAVRSASSRRPRSVSMVSESGFTWLLTIWLNEVRLCALAAGISLFCAIVWYDVNAWVMASRSVSLPDRSRSATAFQLPLRVLKAFWVRVVAVWVSASVWASASARTPRRTSRYAIATSSRAFVFCRLVLYMFFSRFCAWLSW